jgi:putative ABC transport system permease protein
MWRVGLRDLLHRKRRFVVAVLATAIAFGLAMLLSGVLEHLERENQRVVSMFGADQFVVAEGGTGPFSTTRLVPVELVEAVRTSPGVVKATAFAQVRDVLKNKDINELGIEPGGLGWPAKLDGRHPEQSGEVVVDASLGYQEGDEVTLGGEPSTVVGTSHDTTYYFGQPSAFLPLGDFQARFLGGLPLATAVAMQGEANPLPAGTTAYSPAEALTDLNRPQKAGNQTIQIISMLLWIMAAGVVASMLYLSVIERTTELATCKAMGVSNRTLFSALALQGLLLALVSCAVGVLVALALGPTFPFPVEIPTSAYVTALVAAVVVGLVASLIGLRRTTRVEPALAFGA